MHLRGSFGIIQDLLAGSLGINKIPILMSPNHTGTMDQIPEVSELITPVKANGWQRVPASLSSSSSPASAPSLPEPWQKC